MSRGIKTLWIVIGCLFAVGIVLTVAGLALGGHGGVSFGRDGLHFGQRDVQTIETEDPNTATFEDIDISLVQADVEIITAETYGYEFVYTGSEEPEIEVKDGELRVTESYENWSVNFFSFWSPVSPSAKLTVYVPSNAQLDEVELATASGETIFNASGISISSLSCESASGNVYLTGLTLDELKLSVASGDVSLDDVTAQYASLDMASGTLECANTSVETLELELASGDVDFQGAITQHLDLDMVSGDADFNLDGSVDDYTFSYERISGDIRVNDQDITSSSLPGAGSLGSSNTKAHIDLGLTSGSIDLHFTA